MDMKGETGVTRSKADLLESTLLVKPKVLLPVGKREGTFMKNWTLLESVSFILAFLVTLG